MALLLAPASDAILVLGMEPGRTRPRSEPRNPMSPPAATPPSDDRDSVDAALLARVANGDRAALGELYDRFSRPLYSMALRIVPDAADAQDIVHDAFVAVWDKAATFDSHRGTAFSWLVTLVRNRAIDKVRSRRRRNELLSASAPADLGYGESATHRSADDHADWGDEARAVRAAMANLPSEQQKALELAFFGGLTQEEIARSLGEPLGTVKARIRRALLKLRDTIGTRP